MARTTLTFTIGWLKLGCALEVVFDIISLTFTIGWLKPVEDGYVRLSWQPLTFTIGWLKQTYKILISSIEFTLTFTIGWLKRNALRSPRKPTQAFNFHHRVVDKKQKSTQHQLRCCVLFYIFVGITSSCDSCGLNP